MRVKQTTFDQQTFISFRKITFLLATVLFFIMSGVPKAGAQSICQTPTKLANFGLEGQQRTPFATDPDLYPSAIFAFTDDDWFTDSVAGHGLGVIDMTSATGRMWYACPTQGTVAMSAAGFRQVMLAAAAGGPV